MKINSIRNYQLQQPQKHQLVTNNIGFNGENEPQSEEKKSGFSVKKATNVAGVAMWLALVGAGIYKTGLFQKNSAEYISRKAGSIKDQAEKSLKTLGTNDKDELGKQSGKVKSVLKMGEWAHKMETKFGSELYNNLTYAFGTLFVMPLVIWTSPFGKKDSSTSDKFYATIRQPFSVFSALMLQLSFDKMFDQYFPKFIKSNRFESDKVKQSMDQEGKIGIEAFGDIKYNPDEAKRLFQLLPDLEVEKGGLKGLITKDEAKEFVTLDQFADKKNIESYIKRWEELMGTKNAPANIGKRLTEEQRNIVKEKVTVVANSHAYNNLMKQKPKVVMNVLVSSIIGCTFLNVIYGKTLKALTKNSNNKLTGEEVKNDNK
jgi:hypothetical protein